jgi:phage tail sheath protein FI
MADPKTPGVYIEEISTLPASIAPVATAIPAFVGYTQTSEKDGEDVENKPVRITSLLEFKEIFGGPFNEKFEVTLTGDSTDVDDTTVEVAAPSEFSPFLLYYHLQLFFSNGGGPCYIVSVGTYGGDEYADTNPSSGDIKVGDLTAGIEVLEEEDEPTILLAPEAILLSPGDRKKVYDALLAQCNRLQDRFAIMDVEEKDGNKIKDDADAFRNNEVGTGNLKYGAAYYPSLKTSINRHYLEESVVITDNRPSNFQGPHHMKTVDLLSESNYAYGKILITDVSKLSGNQFNIGGDIYKPVSSPSADDEFEIEGGPATTAQNFVDSIKANPKFTVLRRIGDGFLIKATDPGEDGESVTLSYSGSEGATVEGFKLPEPDKSIYNEIKKELETEVDLYPSGAMAGIYARVDSKRGVWKAPANVGIRGITEPNKKISHLDQRVLNVDATSGKSINAIRRFTGKGNLVWGARTLAGNDNEWKYIPVRRLFIFVEESVKKATEFVVFEPNDANTWLRVKTMIENFLTKLWRDGALTGAKPEEAFFVKVGLGETMTNVDILEGRMNVEIGLAAVRPAEFIILKFSHKLQQS